MNEGLLSIVSRPAPIGRDLRWLDWCLAELALCLLVAAAVVVGLCLAVALGVF